MRVRKLLVPISLILAVSGCGPECSLNPLFEAKDVVLWRRGLKVAAIGVVSLLLPRLFAPWIGIAIRVVASMFALPVRGGHWEGMQLVADSGTRVRWHSAFLYRDVARAWKDQLAAVCRVVANSSRLWSRVSLAIANGPSSGD